MRLLMISAAFAALAAAGFAIAPTSGDATEPEIETAALDARHFLLHVNGRASSCKLSRVGEAETLEVGEGCGRYHPPIAAAKRWIESNDGSVAIAGADGRVLVEMAASDGAAFESFSPPAPLMLLVPVE